MPEPRLHESVVRLRFSVGLLGEKSAEGWWSTTFLDASSQSFLDPVFVRTRLLAQFHGVTEAARRVHDARLSAGSFHLFRLPEEFEQDLHNLLRELSSADAGLIPADASSALSGLASMAGGEGAGAPGPRLLGSSTVLADAAAWSRVAAVYHDAFVKGFQSFPYFTRA